MNSKTLLLRCALFCSALFFLSFFGFGQTYLDVASSYGSSWPNSSNNSSPAGGFGPWSISAGANSGVFIGNPSNNGMSTTGIGATAFGMWSTGTAYVNANRSITNGMSIGDELSFHWAMNWDANGGNKGFDFKSAGNTIATINNGGSNPTITHSFNGNVSTGYGTDAMFVKLLRLSSSQYKLDITRRDGSGTFSLTFNSSTSIDEINLYIGGQNEGSGNRNIYFNNFKLIKSGTWIGPSTGNWTDAANWQAGVPLVNSAVTIPNGTTVTLDDINNETSIGSLTINAGGGLVLSSGSKLTLSGNIVNNGAMTIESGATLVQTTNSSTITGGGTYIVKQTLNASGRFWYMGVPIGALTESNFVANLTNGETLKKRDEVNNQWVTISSNSNVIPPGRGYYVQNPNSTPTLTFQGTGSNYAFNNGAITTENLTSSGSSFTGFNLVSNPYPSYIDWVSVTKTNVGGTMWYRTHDGSGMNFGTINSNGVGTTIGSTTVTRYIPPMQSFWVRVSNFGQPASLTFNNSGRSHFISENSSVAGLKSSNVSPSLFVRMNLKQGQKSDQLIVYTDELSSNGLDINDAEKMMQATNPQFYTKVGTQKTVINSLNPSKKLQSLPITLELPTTGVHSFVIEDLEISNGLVWLEDKQEESKQALEPGTVYEFYANSGINAERFVLHFQLIDDATPINVYNEVNSSANFSGKGASVHAEAAGVVVIKLPATTEGITDIQIRDAAGKLVYTGSTNTLETSVQLEQANGIYYVTLNSASGVEVRKVFIQQ
jgi:hypothetical protein